MNVIALTPDRDHYISSIKKYLKYPLIFQRDLNWQNFVSKKPVLAIFLADWKYDLVNFIKKCRDNRIPTILMMDGTIEWKHFFENPKWSYGGNESPYFPVYCDKIFVPGPSTYRFLKYVGGNLNCEITGLPRLDSLSSISTTSNSNNKKVIGIMSGNTVGYNENQINNTIKLFEDLHLFFVNHKKYVPRWRIRKNFEKNLSFNTSQNKNESLPDFLSKVDGVISQPSTVVYESMIMGKNVAVADYNISPNYMQSAWEIKSKDQIDQVIKELINPKDIKLNLQNYYLQDTISNISNSSQIVGDLINAIIEHAKILPKFEWSFPEDMVYGKNLKKNANVNSNIQPNIKQKKLEQLLIKSEVKIKELNQEILNQSLYYRLRNKIFKIFKINL